ncbi:MAG TPA: hypothetical protein VFB07_03085 [Vicinamibacterales bacterium]|nr:hypothetical protein [Vicinamibacterales bacterium]
MIALFAAAASVAAVAVAVMLAARAIAAELRAARDEAARARALTLIALFAPALDAARRDPRALLVWEPVARNARAVAPAEMASLDRAFGGRFPFGKGAIQSAHAQWSADWLAWEAMHDAEYKAKAGEAAGDRARLEVVEREKLDRYQRRYHEYVTVSKALQQLLTTVSE